MVAPPQKADEHGNVDSQRQHHRAANYDCQEEVAHHGPSPLRRRTGRLAIHSSTSLASHLGREEREERTWRERGNALRLINRQMVTKLSPVLATTSGLPSKRSPSTGGGRA
jgi:hypothetical protein